MRTHLVLAAVPLLAIGVVACSGDDDDGGMTTTQDGGSDSGVAAVNGCEEGDYVDQSSGGDARTINFGFTVSPACMKIKKGQTVTFSSDFLLHTLVAFNGDSPNPVSNASGSDTSKTVLFDSVGTFGFKCGVHASMLGAVRVIE